MTSLNTTGFIEPEIDKGENPEIRRKRLRFRSWHRGIKEADILLGNFADNHIMDLSEPDLDDYENLLRESDSDIVAWITSVREAPEHLKTNVMTMLQAIDYLKVMK